MESLKSHTAHRPWALPKSPWSYYQEWNDVVFLHYIVNEDLLRTLVPNQLELDKFDGNCWVSVGRSIWKKFIQDYYHLLTLFLIFMNSTSEHM